MASRISFGQISNRILDRLFTNYNKLEGIQNQLATGKKVNSASDNPVNASQSLEIRSELDQFKSFQRNVDDGLAYLGTVDSTLNTGNNLYQSMRERAIQASNDTNSAESRFYIGREVRGMFDQMVALSNTAFKGEYIFSGTNSQVPPYELRSGASKVVNGAGVLSGNMNYLGAGVQMDLIDKNVDDSKDTITSDANPVLIIPGTLKVNGLTEGTDFTMDYVKGRITFTSPAATAMVASGNADITYDWLRRNEKDLDGVMNREIEEGLSARINSTASDVYGSKTEANGAWEAMINLMEGTINNKPAKIRTSLDQLDSAFKRQLTAQATNGARVQRFEGTQSRNDERTVYTTKLQSEVEDVDFAQAISDFNLQQAVYDASLKMGARALQNTLVNFL
ncbi:MAG TPA: flagellar hook-associated protein FlgL [Fibrobacteria bacterium]|nr:flagellar hook-associated protein FlgL [Fibrobacteria bacterium]